ncbi:MAG: SEC-C domain-containing protein, partial [Mogibacterium sp.]|nr:SEC-C domain-containing protein [Mogibacterium sp.]
DPGTTQFFISLEDDLMRLFGGERMQHVMERVGLDEDEPLEAGMLTRSIEGAQKKVEGKNFGIRKYVLQYDNVMNKQREIIYGQRRMVLDGEDVSGYIQNMTYELIDGIIDPVVMESRYPEEWDLKRVSDGLEQITPLVRGRLQFDDPDYVSGLDENKLRDDVKAVFDQLYEEKEAEIGTEQMREVERMILLRVVDNRWMDHIDAMDQLKDGIGLRGIGQQDPAVAYAQEGFAMFEELVADIREETVKFCYNVTVTTNTQRRNAVSGRTSASKEDYKDDSEPSGNGRGNMPGAAPKAEKTGKQETVKRDMPKVGRNDPCPCGSGKKYKNCCGKNQ